jgi:hypothetical protein
MNKKTIVKFLDPISNQIIYEFDDYDAKKLIDIKTHVGCALDINPVDNPDVFLKYANSEYPELENWYQSLVVIDTDVGSDDIVYIADHINEWYVRSYFSNLDYKILEIYNQESSSSADESSSSSSTTALGSGDAISSIGLGSL